MTAKGFLINPWARKAQNLKISTDDLDLLTSRDPEPSPRRSTMNSALSVYLLVCTIVVALQMLWSGFGLENSAPSRRALEQQPKRLVENHLEVLRRQWESNSSTDSFIELWEHYLPEASCLDLDRTGSLGGGKWLCGLKDLNEAENCVIFSFGLRDSGLFEAALLNSAPKCRQVVFEPHIAGLPQQLQSLAGPTTRRVIWDKVGMSPVSGGVNASGSPSLQLVESLEDSMHRYKVDFVDVLKVSLGSAEAKSLAEAIQRHSPKALFGQILLEVSATAKASEVMDLLNRLHDAGYRIFSRDFDINKTTPRAEYSLLHEEAWEARHRQSTPARVLGSLRGAQMPVQRQVSVHMEERVPKAAIYFLSGGWRFARLKQTLQELHDNCNWRLGYPVYLFLEEMSAERKAALKSVSGGLYEIHIFDIEGEFSRPLPVEAANAPTKTRCSPHSSTIGYRRMCEFHAVGAAKRLMDGEGYEWLWRLDDDSQLPVSIGYDPFRLMAENGQRYGTVVAMSDDSACVEGLWELAEAMAAELEAEGLLPNGLQFFDEWLPALAQYNNFEISHVSVWKNPVWERMWKAIERSGGVWQLRWGDAPMRTLGMLLNLKPSEVRFFQDVAYGHGPFIQQKASGLGAARKVSKSSCNASDSGVASEVDNSSCSNSTGVEAFIAHYSRHRSHGVLSTVPTLRYPPAPISAALPAHTTSTEKVQPLANAVIYSMVTGSTLEALQRQIESFGLNFLEKHPYPMILFVDAGDSASYNTTVAAIHKAAQGLQVSSDGQQFPAMTLLYGDGSQTQNGRELGAVLPFPLRVWRIPRLLAEPAWAEGLGDAKSIDGCTELQMPAQIHRAHLRRLPDLLAHELSFEWLWKVSADSELAEAVQEDPFRVLEERGARIGHVGTIPKPEQCFGGGLFEMALEEAKKTTAGAGELEVTSSENLGEQLEKWGKGKVLLTDSLISHASVWAAPATRRLLGRMDRSAGMWHSGWDEATVVTLAFLAATEGSGDFLRLHALPLRHMPLVPWQTPEPAQFLELPNGQARVRVEHVDKSSGAFEAFQEWFPRAIHPQKDGWIGGDVGTSLELPPLTPGGNSTRLWLFGDSLIGTATAPAPNQTRTSLREMVPHAVAHSRRAGLQVKTAFEWVSQGIFDCSIVAEASLRAGEECVLWPAAGIAVEMPEDVGTKLAIIAQRVARTTGDGISSSVNTLAFRPLGSAVIIIENPHEPSAVWTWNAKLLDESHWWTNGMASATGTAVAKHSDMIHIMGRAEGGALSGGLGWGDAGHAILGRITASDLVALRLQEFSVLTGGIMGSGSQPATWEAAASLLPSASRPASLFEPAPAESTLLFHPGLGLWLSPSVENLHPVSVLTLRISSRPEGPWSQAHVVASLPRDFVGLSCYAAKAHLLNEGDAPLALSAVCVRPEAELKELSQGRADIYTPVFLPLHLSSERLVHADTS